MMRQVVLLVISLAGAGVLSQAPEFIQQYRQNLDGKVEGLSVAVRNIERAGAGGEALSVTTSERDRLAAHERALEEAGPFFRLVEFTRGYDSDVAEAAFDRYEPAAPLTVEGAAHAAGGFFVARGVGLALLGGLAALGFRRRPA